MNENNGDDQWRARKVVITVDDCVILEMLIWGDSDQQVAYQACRQGRAVMRRELDRPYTIQRYSNGPIRAINEGADSDNK